MQKILSIKKFLALALLLAFTIGVTPKLYFHELLTHHVDNSFATHSSGKVQVSSYKFNCGCTLLESVSPFIDALQIAAIDHPQIFGYSYPCISSNNWLQLRVMSTQHRGPPSVS